MLFKPLSAVLMTLFFGGVCFAGDAVRVSDNASMPFGSLVEKLKEADLVFVGEQHAVEGHHSLQLGIIRALKDEGVRLAVGLEMFRADDQPILDRWVSGRLPAELMAEAFADNWGFPWPLYDDIFYCARDEDIPLVGLNLPRDITKKVSEGGFESLSGEDMKKLPPGIGCDLDEGYRKYVESVYGRHNGKSKSFERFCEAQLIWDKVMALHLVEYLKKNTDAVVVVLAGGSHAWKKGIPEQVKKQSEFKSVVILPEKYEAPPGMLNAEYIDYIVRQ